MSKFAKLSQAQIRWYWREWAAVKRLQPDADRHQIHIAALGYDRSSQKLTNAELDLVLAEFWKITKPDSLDAQLRQRNMPRIRALHTIRTYPAIYVQRLCADRFGTRNFEQLPTDKLHQLAMTLNNRRDTIAREPESSAPSVPARVSPCPSISPCSSSSPIPHPECPF